MPHVRDWRTQPLGSLSEEIDMVHGRTRGIIHGYKDERGWLGNMAKAVETGSQFKWLCASCDRMFTMDVEEWTNRLGPTFSMLNAIEISPCCRAPSFLMWSRGSATPFLPMKVEWLWFSREVGFGKDPEAWWQIRYMEPGPP